MLTLVGTPPEGSSDDFHICGVDLPDVLDVEEGEKLLIELL